MSRLLCLLLVVWAANLLGSEAGNKEIIQETSFEILKNDPVDKLAVFYYGSDPDAESVIQLVDRVGRVKAEHILHPHL